MSIKVRLMLLILVAALPVIVLYGWSELTDLRQRVDAAQNQLQRSTRLLAAQQDQIFQRSESILTTMLAAASELRDNGESCNRLLARLAALAPGYTGFGVAQPDGTIFCTSLPAQMLGRNFADREYFKEAIQTRRFSVGDALVGSSSGQPVVGVALPRLGLSGEIEAVGIAALDLTDLSDTIAASSLPQDAVAVVFDGGGTILARTPGAREWVGKPAASAYAEVGRAGGEGMSEGADEDGVDRLWAVTPLLPGEGIFVTLGIPADELLAGAEAQLWRNMALLLVVFAAAALIAWLTADRTIARPLARLEEVVSRLRGGDLSARAEPSSSAPELSQLRENFNVMAGALEGRQAEQERMNAELRKVANEKELLVREMNHRIKNSLQLVSSMIAMQARELSDPEARQQLAAAEARVIAMAKVHNRLYRSERVDRLEFKGYLDELCEDLNQSLALGDKGGSISCEAVRHELAADQIVPLGIIVSELVTNAVKHAHGNGSGRIAVRFSVEGSRGRLTVSDDGVGIPDGFDPAGQPGLGMKVVRALVHQLKAKLSVERLEPGTRFAIDLPVEPAA